MSTFPWLAQFLSNPRQIASISEASSALSKNMAEMTMEGLTENSNIIEIGCGFGSVTKALLDVGVDPKNLICLDLSNQAIKKTRELGVQAMQVDARYLHFLARDIGWLNCQAVVSSLGLLSMPDNVLKEILHSVNKVVSPGGRLIQYTYGTGDPTKGIMSAMNWKQTGKKFTLKNLPPAHVWRWEAPNHNQF